MREVLVLCEGHTEREFCRSVLAPHLASKDISLCGTLVGKPHRKRGRIQPWDAFRAELLRLGKERASRHVALLVDYYRLPADWPGRQSAAAKAPDNRGVHVEQALKLDLIAELDGRFHPCIQLHEFESLLFVEPRLFAQSIALASSGIDPDELAEKMADITRQHAGKVERIDDSPITAPSKRIYELVPGHDKVAWGVIAASDADLSTLRAGCPWLGRWLSTLEGLAR